MSNYKIDGSTVKDPIAFEYDELYQAGKDWQGIYITSAYYEATARFNTLTTSQHAAWMAADDGQVHTITAPLAIDPTTFFTFTGVVIRNISSGISNGLYFYGAQFKVSRINNWSLPNFGG